MPSASEIREQVANEAARRSRLAVPAFAGGFLYLLSAIIISATLSGAPNVGLVQGLSPALSGVPEPAVSPRAPEVKFVSHHALSLILASVLAAIAIGVLVLILLLLSDAISFRRPLAWRAARPLVLYGGIAFVIVSIGHQVVSAIQTHNFAVGHDQSNHAVDQALTKGTPNVIVDYVDLLAGLALAAGTVGVALNAMRIGLLPRWMGFLGVFTGLLLFIPIGGAELQVLPALWMVMIGILFSGRWPSGTPPAWDAGEARPWPSAAQARAERAAGGQPAPAGATASGVPAPTVRAAGGGSRKRRRKRGGRG